MTYITGNIIRAADYNVLLDRISSLYGVGFGDKGYGQTLLTIPDPVTIGSVISGTDWQTLKDMLVVCATNNSLCPGKPLNFLPLDITPGTIVTPEDFETSLAITEQYRTDAYGNEEGAFYSVYNDSDKVVTNFRWSGAIQITMDVKFNNENEARWFFNTGGQLLINFNHDPAFYDPGTGPITPGVDVALDDVFDNLQVIKIGAHTTYNAKGEAYGQNYPDGERSIPKTEINLGYYDLDLSGRLFYNGSNIGSGKFSTISIYAWAQSIEGEGTSGGRGKTIRLVLQVSGLGTSGILKGVTLYPGYEKSSTNLVGIPVPKFALVEYWKTY